MLLHKIKDSLFEDFNGNTIGSGFYISKTSCNLTVLRSVFINCQTTSREGGGGFYADVQAVNVSCCLFNRCFAPDQGCAFHVSSTCQDFFLEYTTVENEEGFEQDGLMMYGSSSDYFVHSNISHIIGRDYATVSWPESQITAYYKYVNTQNSITTGFGLFYAYSNITIESSNIINCTSPYFLCFLAPTGYLFSMIKSVIAYSTFQNLYYKNEPSKNNMLNTYGSRELRDLFDKDSGDIVENPSFIEVFIKCPIGNQFTQCNPDHSIKIVTILMFVIESCPKTFILLSIDKIVKSNNKQLGNFAKANMYEHFSKKYI